MDKLLTFHREHRTPPPRIVRDLKRAAEQIPAAGRAAEAKPLQVAYEKSRTGRRRGPEDLGTLLVAVLARLGVAEIESN